MADIKNKIQCAFCSWNAPRFYTTKAGKRAMGYKLLQQHVEMEHPEEYEKIREQLKDDLELKEDNNILLFWELEE